jgi:hypothetical protein
MKDERKENALALTQGSRRLLHAGLAFLATGIVPLTPAELHCAHPTIFRTPEGG